MFQVDCHDVDDAEFLHVNHQYHRRLDEVIHSVREVLAGKRQASIPNRVTVNPARRYRISSDGSGPKLTPPRIRLAPNTRGLSLHGRVLNCRNVSDTTWRHRTKLTTDFRRYDTIRHAIAPPCYMIRPPDSHGRRRGETDGIYI